MKKLINLLIILLVYSCATPDKLVKRAIKRGLEANVLNDTIRVPYIDSIQVLNERDSLIFVKTIRYRDSVITKTLYTSPKSRQTVRKEAKVKIAEIKADVKIEKAQQKTKRVVVRQESKGKRFSIFWLGLFLGVLAGALLNNFYCSIKEKL